MLRLDRMASKVPLEAPWDAPRATGVGQPDRVVLDAPQHGHRSGRDDARDRGQGGLGGDARGRLAASTCSSTSRSAGKLDLLLDTEGGAQQDRFVEGASTLAARSPRASATGRPRARPCGGSSTTPTACAVRRRSRGAGNAARSWRCRPTLAGRISYDPPLPGLSRSAHPAGPDGRRDQVPGDLRRAVLARGRPQRQRGERRRAR